VQLDAKSDRHDLSDARAAFTAGKLRAGAAVGLMARRRERRRAAALEAVVESEPGPQNEEVAPSPAG
jgi:hypothetical protein